MLIKCILRWGHLIYTCTLHLTTTHTHIARTAGTRSTHALRTLCAVPARVRVRARTRTLTACKIPLYTFCLKVKRSFSRIKSYFWPIFHVFYGLLEQITSSDEPYNSNNSWRFKWGKYYCHLSTWNGFFGDEIVNKVIASVSNFVRLW